MVPKGGGGDPSFDIIHHPNHIAQSGSMSDKSKSTAPASELSLNSNSSQPHTSQHNNKLLSPPFSRDSALVKEPPLLPATVHASHGRSMLSLSDPSPSLNPSPLNTYVRNELCVSRLSKIYRHLWLAGLPRPARSLHRQELIGREIVVSEQTDLHLCWYKARIYIKPLPAFLLHYESWNELAHEKALHAEACGLLMSYTWLVCRESDLKRALEIGLLPRHVRWETWTAFVASLLQHISLLDHDAVNRRYHYGELRVARLNTIFRVLGARNLQLRQIHQGFMTEPDWYTRFLRENFGWLVVVFGYIAIVLNAMQVGLNTTYLSGNEVYQAVAYGFSTFAIAMPVVMFGVIAVLSVGVVWYNVAGTLRYVGRFERSRGLGIGGEAAVGLRWDQGERLESMVDGSGESGTRRRGEKDAKYGR